jgi:hypothetical protein
MTTSPTTQQTLDVPTQVFEKFLQALTDAGASVELVARLRKTLLEDKRFTDGSLQEAVLADEELP